MNSNHFMRRLALIGGLLILASVHGRAARAEITIRRVCLTGDQAPGAQAGVVFSQFGTFSGVGSDFPPRVDLAGNVAFHAILSGTGVTGVSLADGNGLGLWKQVAGVTSLVMRQADAAPGTATGVEFSAFSTSFVPEPPAIAAGRVAFAGALRGPGVDEQFGSNAHGVWRETAAGTVLAARQGDPAPGLPSGHVIRVIGVPQASPAGITFNGVYATPGESPTSVRENQEAFWSDRSGTLEALAVGLQQAPGMEPGVVFGETDFTAVEGAFRSWGSNEALKLAFHGNLRGPGIDALNDEGVWIEHNGVLTLLVREGDPSPAVGTGVRFGIDSGIDTFGEVVPLKMNASGAVVFGARHRGGAIPFTRAVWTTRTGALELVAYGSIPVTGSAPGSPAPGMGPGATFSAIPFVELNDADQIALSGFVTINMDFDIQLQGVWWDRPGSLTLVAREGEHAPGLPGLEFARFNRSLSFGLGGHLAFLADLRESANGEDRGVALVMSDPQGGLHALVRTGVVFDVAGDGSDMRVVAAILPGNVSSEGGIPFELGFLDGSSGIFFAQLAPPPVAVPPLTHPVARASLTAPEPNPRFGNQPITLPFTLAAPAAVRLSLYDVSGREVAVRGTEYFPVAGSQEVRWNPGQMSPGVYFVRLALDSGMSAFARCIMLE